MNDNREPENGGNPWVKSLLVWGGIFLALLLVVSMFSGPREAAGRIVYAVPAPQLSALIGR